MAKASGWDDEEVDTVIISPNIVTPLPQNTTNSEVVTFLSATLLSELKSVSAGNKCDIDKARQNAALALQVQMELANYLAESEGTARGAKNNCKLVEALIASEIRKTSEKKITDAAVKEKCLVDDRLKSAEQSAIDLEVDAKKWTYLFGIAKDAHIFFRNIANGKNEW